MFILTGCGNKAQNPQWNSISQEELNKLVTSTESVDSVASTEEPADSVEDTSVDNIADITETEDTVKNQLITEYLYNYNWDSLPTKKDFKELNIPVQIPADINELISGVYVKFNGTAISLDTITSDNTFDIWYMNRDPSQYHGLSVRIGFAKQNNQGGLGGMDRYIQYCIDNNIWSIKYDNWQYEANEYSLQDVLYNLGKPDHVYITESTCALRDYNIRLIYLYDKVTLVFGGHAYADISNRDSFMDWLEYHQYPSNVGMYVYSDGYIKEKLDTGETLEELYGIYDYVSKDETTQTSKIF